MRLRVFAAITIAVCLTVEPQLISAQGKARRSPESVGLSSERLARLTKVMEEYAKSKQVSGTVTLIARSGHTVYVAASGFRDLEERVPMTTDTIFRIASQTKAVTSVGAMMLVEEGRLLLTDPVGKYIPTFSATTVRGSGSGSTMNRVPARRRITIRDLLTHTAGVSYGGEPDLQELYGSLGFSQWYFADKPQPIGHWIEALAALPFEAQPGERFVYGYSTDILGHVIEKVSGLPLDRYLDTRVLQPLKMTDTHFYLQPAKQLRLATVYARSADGVLTRAPEGHPGQGHYVGGPRTAFAGGAGLLSTASDYARFLQMMLNGGELDGVRLLSPKTVELMTVNHIGGLYPTPGRGFGLGFETVDDLGRSGRYGSKGEFSWGGAYFTRYWVDPAEQLVAVFMTQLLPSGGSDLQEKLRVLVNQAIVGPPGASEVTTTARRPD
ncbi:MAG: serine hydrolase domain-containing protein [Acidobacteriota bacterium]